jgi:hypothetical protein
MKKGLGVPILLCILLMLTTAEAFSATKEKKFKKRHISEDVRLDGAEDQLYPAQLRGISKHPVSGRQYDLTCADINPEMGQQYIIQHDQIGHTWYDIQQTGSMGRMISVTFDGYRHFSWMFTDGPYGAPYYRYIDANCKDPLNEYLGQVHVYGGQYKNAGYSNQTHLHDGRSVVIYHRTAGQAGDPRTWSMLSIADDLCGDQFSRHWDIPDSILYEPSGHNGEWPKVEVKYDEGTQKDYIHIVMTEGNTAGGVPVMIAYQRCYLGEDPDTLYCQAYVNGSTQTYPLCANINYSEPCNLISHFDSSCGITPVPVVSPVSQRVAIAYIQGACDKSCDYLGDIAFIESMTNADDWVDGTNWPPSPTNLTNYGCGYPEEYRAYSDLNACYDYNDSLHIVWSTVGFPEPGYFQPGRARLWHWSKATGIVMITSAVWSGAWPDGHSANIAKMSLSAQDPVFHGGGDSVFLYCTWTQFDTTTPQDNCDADYTNGEIYGCGSDDGGFTWDYAWNLTRTRTPDCTPGNCLSEHWSSLAQNMYDGQLHIQYICDRHAGYPSYPRSESIWTDNPVMYLHLDAWPIPNCLHPPDFDLVEPASWHRPPLKVTPGGSRSLAIKLNNYLGCPEIPYTLSSDHPCVQINAEGVLPPGQSVTINGTIEGGGECAGTFIQGTVMLTLCYEHHPIPVHAIVAEDYYECPIDPETYDTVETSGARVYVNANSIEWVHDISSYPGTVHEVFMQGGSIVATSIDGNKVVGRYMGDKDWRAGVRDKLYTDWCDYSYDYDCWVLYTKNIFIHSPPNPPYTYHCYWYWWEWSKQIKVCEMGDRVIVIKYITVKRHDPPSWWPEADPPQGPYAGHEDTYIGIAMDIDCPWDTLGDENARNLAGYDDVNRIAWQQGWGRVEEHPEYNNYFAGMALADPEGEPANYVPYAAHNVKNNTYLYPQSPWGWDDEELYDLCATAGYTVQDIDSLLDRSQVLVAKHIPAANDPYGEVSFVVVEVATPNGLTELQALVDTARAIVIRGALPLPSGGHGFPVYCGDATGNFTLDLGDAVFLLGYLFKHHYPPPCPMNRADTNGDGIIDVGDVVVILNYLFKGDDPPDCPGIW